MFSKLKKPYLIAEISGNHNGSLKRAKEIIKLAKVNGADCVKLQTYTPETMTIKSSNKDFLISKGLWKGYRLWDLYKHAHTPFKWHKELFDYAKKIKITCISTPFDETAVDLLENLKVPFYKIASFEITDIPLIKYIAKKNKPIMLSTGMANLSEITRAVKEIKIYNNKEITLADIPGLIEHASAGKGLGHDFLSHVERCKILIHVVDITEEKPFENYKVIRQELLNYGGKIEQKKEIIALNKIEIADQKRVEEIKKEFETLNQEVKLISAATGHQLDQLTNLCLEYLQDE